ncbi:amylo-alpha-1,6-glucosidase [Archaeoglobus veneficus]|uniref:Amylo-alpha-16-glucosidase n=1 Tax=Archaeoglobus veneficus (strain DSM 11195 / SNP6) TaxID=693661 RepID=F2KMN3_ARCVS|nr:amylo-alpha-1,6-glucosidase [Archaeoglobus veneficus]AEA47230.1 Amylo-alpha-16-glucosidase [Archaeoglobus veneficus SNP6]
MIGFGRELKDYSFASRREFILVSGNAYCSSSLAGNTRKYHGLLVCNGRVYLSALDEFVNGRRISSARYADCICDEGLEFIQAFGLYPPTFHYFIDSTAVRKTISFDGAVRITYDVCGKADIAVVPLVADRGVHKTRKTFDFRQKKIGNGVSVGKLTIKSSADFYENPDVYWNVFYERDFERGYECVENLYTPGRFIARVSNGSFEIVANVDGCEIYESLAENQKARSAIECLELAANSFVVGDTIYAGHHWFAEPWGRDTFVSLPGLLIERSRLDVARKVFKFFATRMKRGLIPNRTSSEVSDVSDQSDCYNSSDASLWFVYALEKYLEKTGDTEFVEKMKPYVEDIVVRYPESGVAELDKGLISVRACSTWMDTRFTPREGKPVEVNALWINTLRFADRIGIHCPDSSVKAEKAFRRFWNPKKGCFYDVIDPYDDSIRPSQVIAVALNTADEGKATSILEVVGKELLTPYGLRTLSPRDKRYIGRFRGDESYHNGCVWPWLLGFYVEALLNHGWAKDRLQLLIAPLLEHVRDVGLGTISEIFDGDAPHEPNGCISQAWSVAEVIRAYRLLE